MRNSHKLFKYVFLFFFFLTPQLIIAADEKIELTFDGRTWKIGYEAHDETQSITEYVLEGESIDHWTELVTLHIFAGFQNRIPIKTLMERMLKDLYKTCPSTQWEILHETAEDLVYTWQIKDCPAQENQYEVARLMVGKEAIHLIRYTHKSPDYDHELYPIWLNLISNAKISQKSDLSHVDFSEGLSYQNTEPENHEN